ncbi:MAG: hypothetical protein KBS52_02160 [Clostridiales bacterium]|nr:hypothetical protein [Candidatus Equinaster intestinalis]
MFARSKHGKHNENSLINEDIKKYEINGSAKGENTAPHALTVEEVLGKPERKTEEIKMQGAPKVSPLEALKKKAIKTAEDKKEAENPKPVPQPEKPAVSPKRVMPKIEVVQKNRDESVSSLLEKCMPYITEGGGKIEEEKPAYTLDSIDEIINNADTKAKQLIDKLNNMGVANPADVTSPKKPEPEKEQSPQRPAADKTAKPITDTRVIEMAPDPAYKISDIDSTDTSGDTIHFDLSDKTKPFDDISSGTNILDLQDEIFESDKTPEKRIITDENFAPEKFKVEGDYLSFKDAKRIGGNLLKKSRGSGIQLILTALINIALLCAKIPSIHDALYLNQSFFSTISGALLLVACLINYDAFTALKSFVTPRPRPEATIGISLICSVLFTLSCLSGGVNPYNWVLFACTTLLFKCIAVSMRNTYIINNFRIIATKRPKRAIKFIYDRQITFAMAKNSIDGEALVGLGVKCENVQEFLKYTYQDSPMNGLLRRFTAIILGISAVISIGIGIYNSSISSCLQTLCLITGFAFAPTVMFTDIFPLMRASDYLNKRGAMIAGTTAAKEIELANAVAVRTVDIFPAGTVTLSALQTIAENDINQTLLDAAAILKQIESPLFDIFNRLVKATGKELPTADSIKYEEALGVSGWVGNRHVFIGNRTLLTAHGIKTPKFGVDKKILASNNFPIYVASGEVPCAVLAVKYNVDTSVAEELIKLSDSGVMILVDSCDQNVTSQMICDYFGLADGSVHIMGSSGAELYKNAAKDEDGISACAAFRDTSDSIFSIFSRAAKIKRTVTSLTLYHIIATVILTGVFVYNMFFGNTTPLESGMMPVYTLISLAISYIVSLFNK